MAAEIAAWVRDRLADGLRPELAIPVSEWADRHRILPPTAAEPGRWRTSRTPYLREIMDHLSASSAFERVVLQKGIQIGATEAGLCWVAYIIDHAPGLIMLVMPSIEAVRRNSGVRIDPLIESCPVLREKVVEPRSKEPGNSIFRKKFPGGELVMTGANSAVGLRSTPARYLFLDEVDGFPQNADNEGDPVSLAIGRTATFRGTRKIFMASTPTLKGGSRIEAAYLESDQRRYYVPCQGCGAFSPIEWSGIVWPEGQRELAGWSCPACDHVHQEHHKPALLANGQWRPTAKGDGRTAGYHLSALYSPWMTWAEAAIEHGQVYRDPPRLQVWTNCTLGESWEDQAGEAIEPDPLMARREDWGILLPAGVVLLTAGVDVQKDRLELQVTAWGRDEESWVIQYLVIWGDPSGPRVWMDLDAALQASFPHSRAVPDLPIRAVAIDTGGHYTQIAYEFTRTRLNRRIWGVKGRGGMGIPAWPRRPTKLSRGKGVLFPIGVDSIKDVMFCRLKLAEPGPGYIHFSKDQDAEYFRQLTSERVVTTFQRGRPIRSWQMRTAGERNEALDCSVYCFASLQGLISMGLQLNREATALEQVPLKSPTAAPVAPPKRGGRRIISSQYMG